MLRLQVQGVTFITQKHDESNNSALVESFCCKWQNRAVGNGYGVVIPES
jgi:hypothetical protein